MEPMYVMSVRVIALSVLLYTSFNISLQGVIAAICFIGSLIILKPTKKIQVIHYKRHNEKNPLKGKPKVTELSPELTARIQKDVTDLVTYDADCTETLNDFQVVKMNSECIFAKKSHLWGAPSWDNELSIDENVYRFLPTFLKFSLCCEFLGLDGFLVQVPERHSLDVDKFGSFVRNVLRSVSKHDPRGLDCMRDTTVNRKGWVFRFHTQTFFITTFAPCYPQTHSRYNFDSPYGYILFQPEISFAQHNLPEDTPSTNWDLPITVRDRIRVAFREAGRLYHIRDTVTYPMAYDIVKPVDDCNVEYIEWWEDTKI